MAIYYQCRHCGIQLGTIDHLAMSSEKLGFHKLTEQERLDIISYDTSGNIHVKTICEDCYESLERNPDYYQNDYIIH